MPPTVLRIQRLRYLMMGGLPSRRRKPSSNLHQPRRGGTRRVGRRHGPGKHISTKVAGPCPPKRDPEPQARFVSGKKRGAAPWPTATTLDRNARRLAIIFSTATWMEPRRRFRQRTSATFPFRRGRRFLRSGLQIKDVGGNSATDTSGGDEASTRLCKPSPPDQQSGTALSTPARVGC
jgi:hypothetical protein